VATFGNAGDVGRRLEDGGIITTPCRLPHELGRQGVRLGVQEITRRGAPAEAMAPIASLIADVVLERRSLPAARADAHGIAAMFPTIGYTLDDA
jgi:glycine/serine hydroxymethyltransferase